jgi:Amt family ammonium transporter
MVALFALPAFGGGGFGHDLNGPQQIAAQALGVGAAIAWSMIGTVVIIALLRAIVGLKLSVDEQREGLDFVIHGERAYDLSE